MNMHATDFLSSVGPLLIGNGYDILPIQPGTKSPNLPKWTSIRADSGLLGDWLDEGRGSWGVGVLGESTPAVDLDVTDPVMLETLHRWCNEHIGAAPCRIGRAPRSMLIYRAATPFAKMKSRKYRAPDGEEHQVEIIGRGGQFVAYAVHPVTGQPYTWPGEDLASVPIDMLPELTVEKARELIAFFEASVPADWTPVQSAAGAAGEHAGNAKKTAALDVVASAAAALPNGDLDYDDWVRIAHAVRAAAGDHESDGLEIFHEWSAKSEKYDVDETERVWHSIGQPKTIGAGTLFYLAEREGWKRPRPTALDDFDLIDLPAEDVAPKARHKRGFFALSLADCAARAFDHPVDELIAGLVSTQSMVVVYGASSVGKTFVLLDMFHAIATGIPWAGRETKAGAVFYLAAEGGHGINARAAALLKGRGGDIDPPLFVIPCTADLYSSDADARELVTLMRGIADRAGLPIRAVAFDTLARTMGAGDENTTRDMQHYVNRSDLIRDLTGAATFIVHHSGKDTSKGARGSGALRAATDTEIEVAALANGIGTIATPKQRDRERLDDPIRFRLQSIAIGVDDAGRAITCPVPQYLDAGALELMDLVPIEQSMFDVLCRLHEETNEPVDWSTWRDHYLPTIRPDWLPGGAYPRGHSQRTIEVRRNAIVDAGHARRVDRGRYEPL